jgi:hypothetical protein
MDRTHFYLHRARRFTLFDTVGSAEWKSSGAKHSDASAVLYSWRTTEPANAIHRSNIENNLRRAVARLPIRSIAGAHSPRRYLHIEAVFVFDSQADHLSVASGQADRRTRNTPNRK